MNGEHGRHTPRMVKHTFHFHRAGLLAMGAAVLVVTFATGFALGYGSHSASTVTSSTCDWRAFPTFPGALTISAPSGGIAYRVYGVPYSQVVRFYQQGAGQDSWSFTRSSSRGAVLDTFRVDGPNGCRGIVTIQIDAGGGTRIEASSS